MIRSDLVEYGAVTTLHIESRTGLITGYATPRIGPRPAALSLTTGDTTIAVVRASRYSQTAAEAGIRAGWCGFELPGLAQAFALGSDVAINCVATGKVLERLAFSPDVFEAVSPPSQPLSAAEVFFAGSLGERCSDLEQVMPFAIDHRNRHGARSFMEATYQMLLDRLPDTVAYKQYEGVVTTDAGLIEFLDDITASDEYARYPLRVMPGPFHPAFRYDRGLLG
ncbi:hypothetical protein [Brevundimonas sp. NIBR11]|uniref:hypothetical protein n=1 Tax=Brevundimonas sp. NIBR11 TaxID=3015999 RepID=UPI0022F06273|nr:hypothetical protein [Brevundimonas sp. NIBR11]WGM32288.1 hypothetical protein KKHFBJBL_02539 [Brevundimonas sp. NIBR11]